MVDLFTSANDVVPGSPKISTDTHDDITDYTPVILASSVGGGGGGSLASPDSGDSGIP